MRILTIHLLATFFVAAVALGFAPAAVAQAKTPRVAQVVALDECDPVTFNAALGPDFCKNLAVAKTRILQGSQTQVTNLSKGEHLFECCIHPWMRVKVEVKGEGESVK